MQQQSYDLIVVGTGTAGAILASRIAQHGVNPRTGEPLKIASIEAGPYWKGERRPGYGIPLRRRMITNLDFGGDRYQWPTTGYAKIVGGSSVHFGNASYFPFDTDYLRWQNERKIGSVSEVDGGSSHDLGATMRPKISIASEVEVGNHVPAQRDAVAGTRFPFPVGPGLDRGNLQRFACSGIHTMLGDT